jgi:hypothetical protein
MVLIQGSIVRKYSLEDEAFFRRVVFPEEDRHLFTAASWHGGFRWFRAANVTPIEWWRRVEEVAPQPKVA